MIHTQYELDVIEQAARTLTDRLDAAVEALKAIVTTAADEYGCNWCGRSSTWGHEDFCPIPAAVAVVATSES